MRQFVKRLRTRKESYEKLYKGKENSRNAAAI